MHLHPITLARAKDLLGSISPQSASLIRAQIGKERARILATKGLAEEERDRVQQELKEREKELIKAQEQHSDLEKKFQELNSQVDKYFYGSGSITM